MSAVILDTDVASAVLRRRISTTLARQLAGKTLAITFVTAATCGGAHVAEFVIRLACPTGRSRLLRAA